ncbi:MAG TPA: hypothetical protein VF593_00475 [Chthoniobacteraceae bacterium]|jgi:hypothetical protein
MDLEPEPFLSHRPEDRLPLSVEDLSQHACLSRAFIRLCLDHGCPAQDGLVSQAAMVDWLCSHYPEIRETAGLRVLPSVEDVPAVIRQKLQAANTMLTMLEYTESRCSDPVTKARLRSMQDLVERAG